MPSWTKSTSAWSVPQECFWPIDESDGALCSLSSGAHKCGTASAPGTCGSNSDALGNYRFTDAPTLYESMLGYRLQETFTSNLYWGLLNFDTTGEAFLFIFKVITFDSWADHMIKIKDAVGDISIVYFVFLSLFGGLGIMQVLFIF